LWVGVPLAGVDGWGMHLPLKSAHAHRGQIAAKPRKAARPYHHRPSPMHPPRIARKGQMAYPTGLMWINVKHINPMWIKLKHIKPVWINLGRFP